MTAKDAELPINNWGIGLLWAGANVLSIFGGMLLGSFLNGILWSQHLPPEVDAIIINPIQRAFTIGLSIGGISGLLEALVLQRYGIKWSGWLLACMLGWAIGITTTDSLTPFLSGYGINLLSGGTIMGFTQWIVLRRYIPKAYWWIIATAIGSVWMLSWIPLGYTFSMILESYIFFIVTGLILGIMRGATLSWLLTLSWLEQH